MDKLWNIAAEKGDQVMKDLVFENAGARALGECALVPDPSPISQSGITFFNTLFDENASNPLGYRCRPMRLASLVEQRWAKKSLKLQGLTVQMFMWNFMIGSSQMDIDGIREEWDTCTTLP